MVHNPAINIRYILRKDSIKIFRDVKLHKMILTYLSTTDDHKLNRTTNKTYWHLSLSLFVWIIVYSHANITICIEELHLGARLNPAHSPCFVSGNRGHHNPSRSSEVWGLVSQDNGRILLNDGRALVNGGWDLIDHYVLPSDAGLAGDALNATHGPAY